MKLANLIRTSNYSAALLVLFAIAPLGFAQNVAPTATAPAKPPAFEVVAIRPSKPPNYPGATGGPSTTWGTQPDGYRASNQTIWSTIAIAYFPQGMAYWTGDRILNGPKWATDSQYDINAKVSELDLPEWTKQNSLKPEQKVLFQQMLQSMLADRCKLAFHRIPGEISSFALVLGKRGAKLPLSAPGAALPSGMKFPDGGVAVGYNRGEPAKWTYYNATLADLVQMLNNWSGGHPVVDKTGISGHYDFVLHWADVDPDHPEGGVVYSGDPNPLSHWDLDSLGLHLEPTKIPVDTLVIDHIEKPSEN
jgi:uncharacterized protein (TIGR03435 family)